jgi:DNA-binding transcriptional MerR regulator
MILKDGKAYETIAEAAKQLGGVSAKTVREWIRKGIIDEPPTLEHGIRTMAYFPPKYIKRAKERLRDQRKSIQSRARRPQ